MAVAVAIHLVGGLAVILYLRPRMDAQPAGAETQGVSRQEQVLRGRRAVRL